MAHTEAGAQKTTQEQQQQQQQKQQREQQQQKQGRPKERQDSPPKRARTEIQDSQVQPSEADAADDPRPRPSGQRYAAVTGKKVFFERYSDSPEFSRFKNPVVQMRNRTRLDDEDASDVIDPTSKLANYQSPMDRRTWNPMDLRRLAVFGAHKQANANAITKNQQKSSAEKTAASSDPSFFAGDWENLVDDEDEEPGDDTFEFLLK